ncbi:MAG: UDP-glucose 4-epimerase GalE [Sporomusaceae bacterium]|nr:UDP-glucose 4-epimerase GalE [Sporomusaceae bacterium]
MNVLIIGGAGYIGSHCNKFFSQQGLNTFVLDNLALGHAEAVKYGTFIAGDAGDKVLLKDIFTAQKIDAVVHFAAFAAVGESVESPSKYYNNNVSKMIDLLDVMVECGIKYFIFSSSAATFGEPLYLPIDEAHGQNPINPYGETKLIGEKLLRDYEKAYGIKYAALRYFNAAGADPDAEIGESHQPEYHLIPLILQTALGQREKLSVYGKDYDTPDGTCVRDFVHVVDLAEAHYLALEYLQKNNLSACFNLGNNIGYTILEVIKVFERLAGVKVNFSFAARRAGDPARLIASNEKAKELLNWDPKLSSLETILATAWNWEQNRKY